MTTHARRSLELGTAEVLQPTRRGFVARRWKELLAGGLVLLAGIALLIWFGGHASERRALLRMNPEDRRALYAETYRNAEVVCEQATRETELLERCADSAAFLRLFPECDARCRAFSEAHHHGATR